jgi:hypothetical protein
LLILDAASVGLILLLGAGPVARAGKVVSKVVSFVLSFY